LPKQYARLTTPLVRDGGRSGSLRPATWDEALDRTVAGLRAALASRAPDAERPPIGIFSCSKATNEVNFAAQKLSRQVLGSNNVDSCNRT
jgi:predicted molibdopterin-dependent oxidoreductase YjgC